MDNTYNNKDNNSAQTTSPNTDSSVASQSANAVNSTPPSLFRSTSDDTAKTPDVSSPTTNVSNTGTVTTPDTANSTTTAAGTTDIFAQFAQKIIKEQEGIIGPIAYEQALKVQGLTIDPATHAVKMEGDKKLILENLVKQYELLFGRVSIEICKEAIRGDIATAPRDQIPQVLL